MHWEEVKLNLDRITCSLWLRGFNLLSTTSSSEEKVAGFSPFLIDALVTTGRSSDEQIWSYCMEESPLVPQDAVTWHFDAIMPALRDPARQLPPLREVEDWSSANADTILKQASRGHGKSLGTDGGRPAPDGTCLIPSYPSRLKCDHH